MLQPAPTSAQPALADIRPLSEVGAFRRVPARTADEVPELAASRCVWHSFSRLRRVPMRLRPLEEIRQSAAVYSSADAAPMTRQERLERWATILDKHPGKVQMLHSTEFAAEPQRRVMRQDNSPIAVAYADPVLRLQGLAGDTYEDARQFFEL